MRDRDNRRGRKVEGYTISAVSEKYGVHPQTLRIYEREGLLKPFRSAGNTRYYTARDLERLEAILTLTRDMGVNLAGVEVILRLRDQMEHMKTEMSRFLEAVHTELSGRIADRETNPPSALVPRFSVRSAVCEADQDIKVTRSQQRRVTVRIHKKGGDLNP